MTTKLERLQQEKEQRQQRFMKSLNCSKVQFGPYGEKIITKPDETSPAEYQNTRDILEQSIEDFDAIDLTGAAKEITKALDEQLTEADRQSVKLK